MPGPMGRRLWLRGLLSRRLNIMGRNLTLVCFPGKCRFNVILTHHTAECNNATAFPGIGLGCILSRATRLSDKMLVAAIASLAAQSPALKDPTRPLLPDVEDVRRISAQIACAVIKQAVEEGLNRIEDIPVDNEDLLDWVKGQMWNPVYRPLKKVDKSTSSRAAKGELGIGRLGASE